MLLLYSTRHGLSHAYFNVRKNFSAFVLPYKNTYDVHTHTQTYYLAATPTSHAQTRTLS